MSNRLDELTAFEESIAERTAGMSLASLEDKDAPKVGLLGALAWVHVKRGEPKLTYDEYMKRSSSGEIARYLFDEDEVAEDGFPDPAGSGARAGDDESQVLPGDGSAAG